MMRHETRAWCGVILKGTSRQQKHVPEMKRSIAHAVLSIAHSVKRVFLEISQNSQEIARARVSFLIKLQAWGHRRCSIKKGVLRNIAKSTGKRLCQGLFKKETLAQAFSCEFCEISKNTVFYRTPPVAASVLIRTGTILSKNIKNNFQNLIFKKLLVQSDDQTDIFWKFYSRANTLWSPKTVGRVLCYTTGYPRNFIDLCKNVPNVFVLY